MKFKGVIHVVVHEYIVRMAKPLGYCSMIFLGPTYLQPESHKAMSMIIVVHMVALCVALMYMYIRSRLN